MASNIISRDTTGVLTVHTERLKECLSSYLEKRVKVISVCGEFRTGKSFLMNTWMNKHGVFEVGHTTKSQTWGVWMGVIEKQDQVIILLDFEGWFDSLSDTLDIWLPLIMMFISSEVVLNVSRQINFLTVKSLLSILIVCKNDAASAKPENWQIPYTTIIVRDFLTNHEGGQSDDEYLNSILSGGNTHSRVLKNYLGEKKKCYTLPLPHIRPTSLGEPGQDGKIVEADPEFLKDTKVIFNDILTTHKSTPMKCSDWIKVVLHVTQMIEEIRQSDPEETRIDMSIPKRELLDMVNTHFVDCMARLDVVTKDLQQLRGGQPYNRKQGEKNQAESLKETKNAWGECDNNLLQFANDFHTAMTELNDLTAKDYEQLYGSNTSLKGFEAHLTKSCHVEMSLKETRTKIFYLNQHLHLQKNIVKRWMDDHIKNEIQRSLDIIMKRVNEKDIVYERVTKKNVVKDQRENEKEVVSGQGVNETDMAKKKVKEKKDVKKENLDLLKRYLQFHPPEMYGKDLYSFLEKVKSPDLLHKCQFDEIIAVQIIYLQNIIQTCFVPFTELQHQFLLPDVQRDFIFGNLLEVYNSCVKFWNIFLEPVCKETAMVDVESLMTSWKRVSLLDVSAPLIKYQKSFKNMNTYIANQGKQHPGLDHFLGWCEGHLRTKLLSANKKIAEHCRQVPVSLKKLLGVILKCQNKTECPEIYRNISRLDKRLNSDDNVMLDFELSEFTKYIETHQEAKVIEMSESVQFMIHEERGPAKTELKQLLKAEHLFVNKIRLLVLLQKLINQMKEVYLMGDFDNNIFHDISNVHKNHLALWESLANRQPLDVHTLSKSLKKFTSDLEAHRHYICEKQEIVRYMKHQMSEKTHFATLLTLVVKQKWWKTKEDLVDILKAPEKHMEMLLSKMRKIQYLTHSPTSAVFEQGKTNIEKLLLAVKEAEDTKKAVDKKEPDDKKDSTDLADGQKKKSPEFERTKTLLKETSNLRIEQIKQNVNRLVETSPQLCEEFIYCHHEFWVRRSYTLHVLRELGNDLQNGKLGFDITKLLTSVGGIAGGGLGIASVFFPFLLPAAIATGVTVGVSTVATGFSSYIFSNIMENNISAALLCDTISCSAFESAFKKLENEIEQQQLQQTLNTPEVNVNPADAISGTLRSLGATVHVGRGVLKAADMAADPLIAAGRIAGVVAGGIGILVDAVQMAITISDMVENGTEDERSQYVSECIELMELEMEYNANIAIPLKYHMFKRCIENVMHKQK